MKRAILVVAMLAVMLGVGIVLASEIYEVEGFTITESPGTSQLIISRSDGHGFHVAVKGGNQGQTDNTLQAEGSVDYRAYVSDDDEYTLKVYYQRDGVSTNEDTFGSHDGIVKITFRSSN